MSEHILALFSFLISFIYLLLAVPGLCGCAGFSLVAGSLGYSSFGALSFHCSGFSCGAQTLRHLGFSSFSSQALEHRLNSCGAWVQLLLGMWDLPRSGIEPVSPSLAGRCFITEPPGKPNIRLLFKIRFKNRV